MHGAVAVDLGASSGRIAAGRLVDGRIEFEIIEQIPHAPVDKNGKLEWQIEDLLGLCRRAVAYGDSHFESATLGIDSWGVDHGFLDERGELLAAPVCYRDLSHTRAQEDLKNELGRLFKLTGIQHQPFNTSFQLYARRQEDPAITGCRWMILPDLLGYLLGGDPNHETTQASTTQLLGLDGKWCEEAFQIIGWPVPEIQPSLPGGLGKLVGARTRLAHVGSHDTASAVAGFGALQDNQVFLNVGTWSLVGTVVDEPIVSAVAEEANFTNERCVDGRVRFLKNVPGFYVINRLHDELGVAESVPLWLANAEPQTDEMLDFFDESFYNPESMVSACSCQLSKRPYDAKGWAFTALTSLAAAIAKQPRSIEAATGRRFRSIRVGGGGSQSSAFCQVLADMSRLEVIAGPTEATVLGNLGAQLLAAGALESWSEVWEVVARSAAYRHYLPSA